MADVNTNAQNRHIIIKDNNNSENVSVVQEVTNVVEIKRGAVGPRGPEGAQGPPGALDAFVDLDLTGSLFANNPGHITASGNISASGAITASGLLGTSSFATNTTSASFTTTASFALNVPPDTGFPFTGSAGISGSLDVVGIVSSSGFSGSLEGTASFATSASNAHSASFSVSASNTTQASSASFATTASFISTASFATSASFAASASDARSASFSVIAEYTSEWALTADASNHYIFTGPGFTGSASDPSIYLVRGQKYKFTNRMGAHPFRIQLTPNGAAGTQYNNGVTNNDVSNGSLIFDVPMDAPEVLYYQCTSHGVMGGPIYISHPTSASFATTASFALNGGGTGDGFPFTGSAGISGSLNVRGPITASSISSSGAITANQFTINQLQASQIDDVASGGDTNIILNGTTLNIDVDSSTILNTTGNSAKFNVPLTSSIVSASSGITGSLFGTASFATTASFALNAGSTGDGFPFTGSAGISGSLLLNGPLNVTGASGSISASVIQIGAGTQRTIKLIPGVPAGGTLPVITSNHSVIEFQKDVKMGFVDGLSATPTQIQFLTDGTFIRGRVNLFNDENLELFAEGNILLTASGTSSVLVDANISSSGAITASGFLGTASFATSASDAHSASFSVSASNATQASSASFATTASFISTASFATSASQATTASFALNAGGNIESRAPFLFTLVTSSTQGSNTPSGSGEAGFTPGATIGGGTVGFIYFSTQSANGVRMSGNNPGVNPTSGDAYFRDAGSQVTLISTSSGKFVRVKISAIDNRTTHFQYQFQQALIITGSGGFPDDGDTVEMRWDNSAGVGTLQSALTANPAGFIDPTSNPISLAFRTSSQFYAPSLGAPDEGAIPLTEPGFAFAFISKSADLGINFLTASFISTSGIIETDTINADSGITGSKGLISIQQEQSHTYPQTVNGRLRIDDKSSNHTSLAAGSNITAGFTIGNRSSTLNNYSGITFVVSQSVGRIAYQRVDDAKGDFIFLPQFNASDRSELLRISGKNQNISASVPITASGLFLDFDSMPTSDPGVKGAVYRSASLGNQLFISAG